MIVKQMVIAENFCDLPGPLNELNLVLFWWLVQVPHLLQVVKRRIIKNNLSRKNILFRDNYTCQ